MSRSTAHAAASGAVGALNSELLELPLLLEGLVQLRPRRSCVLDFGPIQHRILNDLEPARGQLHVVDLSSNTDQKQCLNALERAVAAFDQKRCDLILTWDRLNYLDPSGLSRMNSMLDRIAAGNMKLHALIRYAKPEMPIEPDRYVLLDQHQIERQTQTAKQMQAPRYSPKALEKHMPGFKVDRTRLLGNGMQEFMLHFGS